MKGLGVWFWDDFYGKGFVIGKKYSVSIFVMIIFVFVEWFKVVVGFILVGSICCIFLVYIVLFDLLIYC